MSRYAKIAAKLPAYGLDAMLITSSPNRLYANEFASSAGAAVVTAEGSYFFVDSRYIEAATNRITGGQVRLMDRDHPYADLVNEVIEKHGVKTMGYEESYITVEEFNGWQAKLKCDLVPDRKSVV